MKAWSVCHEAASGRNGGSICGLDLCYVPGCLAHRRRPVRAAAAGFPCGNRAKQRFEATRPNR